MLLMGLIRIRSDCECNIRTIVPVLEEDKRSFAAVISAIIFKGSYAQSFSAPVNIIIQRLPHCVEGSLRYCALSSQHAT